MTTSTGSWTLLSDLRAQIGKHLCVMTLLAIIFIGDGRCSVLAFLNLLYDDCMALFWIKIKGWSAINVLGASIKKKNE